MVFIRCTTVILLYHGVTRGPAWKTLFAGVVVHKTIREPQLVRMKVWHTKFHAHAHQTKNNMPRSMVNESPTVVVDDAYHAETGSLDSMERGDYGQPAGLPPTQQQQQQGTELRVTVAATEARDEEGDNQEREARNHLLLAKVFSVLLKVLVMGFTCFFIYAWVDFLHKVRVPVNSCYGAIGDFAF